MNNSTQSIVFPLFVLCVTSKDDDRDGGEGSSMGTGNNDNDNNNMGMDNNMGRTGTRSNVVQAGVADGIPY